MEILATSLPELAKPSKTFKHITKNKKFRGEFFKETDLFVFMDGTISDGSGGESYTAARAESESEVETDGKTEEKQNLETKCSIKKSKKIGTQLTRVFGTQLTGVFGTQLTKVLGAPKSRIS